MAPWSFCVLKDMLTLSSRDTTSKKPFLIPSPPNTGQPQPLAFLASFYPILCCHCSCVLPSFPGHSFIHSTEPFAWDSFHRLFLISVKLPAVCWG